MLSAKVNKSFRPEVITTRMPPSKRQVNIELKKMKPTNHIRKTAAAAVTLSLLLALGCSKNTINLSFGDTDDPAGSTIPKGSTLVTFNASVENRNLLTRAMSPMEKGIQNRLFAYKYPVTNLADATPMAEGLYITSSPGTLIGSDGYKMYLQNGIYDFYAVSDNFSTIPPTFTVGLSEPLYNGIDYLWWHSPQHDVNSTQVNVPIIYLHAAAQVVIQVTAGTDLTLRQLVSAMITPPQPGARMNIATGEIPPATTYGPADKMGINGMLAQYIMLPLQTDTPLTLTLEVVVEGETDSRHYEVQVPLPDGRLKAGNSYLFLAVIEENSVTFPSVSIKNWTEVDEEGNPLYPIQE